MIKDFLKREIRVGDYLGFAYRSGNTAHMGVRKVLQIRDGQLIVINPFSIGKPRKIRNYHNCIILENFNLDLIN